MESRRRRKRAQLCKWGSYFLLMLLCTVLQTTPGLFQIGPAKPLFLLPLCLAVAVCEGEFAGALFGMVCGLMWDYTAGRTVGMLALSLMALSFAMSVMSQLYLRTTRINFALLSGLCSAGLLSVDHLFFYVMPGYSGALWRYLRFVPPATLMTAVLAAPLFWAVQKISERFRIDNGVV